MFGFAQGKADDFIEDVQITAAGIGGTVEYVSDEIGDAIQDKAESVVETATDIGETVAGTVGDITDNVSENIQVATAAVGGFFNHVGSFFGEAVDAGKVAAEEKRKELDA